MRRIQVGQAALAVWDEGEGPALVALHAGVADTRSWSQVVPAWRRAGWRVIAYDRRGFGDSEWTAEPHSPREDLLAVMDALDVPRAVLVGCSQGGRIAIETAIEDPDRVAGLVLIGTAVTDGPWPIGEPDPAEARLDEAAEAAADAGDLDGANRFEARLWLDGPLQPEGRVPPPARRLFLDMNGRALAAPAVGEQRWTPGAFDRATEIDCPTLVLHGALDETVTREWAAALADRIPGARRWELPRSAHLPMLDDPAALASITVEFLDLLDRGA